MLAFDLESDPYGFHTLFVYFNVLPLKHSETGQSTGVYFCLAHQINTKYHELKESDVTMTT